MRRSLAFVLALAGVLVGVAVMPAAATSVDHCYTPANTDQSDQHPWRAASIVASQRSLGYLSEQVRVDIQEPDYGGRCHSEGPRPALRLGERFYVGDVHRFVQ